MLHHEAVTFFKNFLEPVVAALEEVSIVRYGMDSLKIIYSLLYCVCNLNCSINSRKSFKFLSHANKL